MIRASYIAQLKIIRNYPQSLSIVSAPQINPKPLNPAKSEIIREKLPENRHNSINPQSYHILQNP